MPEINRLMTTGKLAKCIESCLFNSASSIVARFESRPSQITQKAFFRGYVHRIKRNTFKSNILASYRTSTFTNLVELCRFRHRVAVRKRHMRLITTKSKHRKPSLLDSF